MRSSKATVFVIAGNRNINFSTCGTSEVWGCFCLGDCSLAKHRWAMLHRIFSLFQHLLERYVENLSINRAEGGKNSNSDQDSVQWSICLQFSFKSGWSHNGVLFTVSSTLEHALATLAPLHNDHIICLHVRVFFYIWAGGHFPNDSLFIVWNNEPRVKEDFRRRISALSF